MSDRARAELTIGGKVNKQKLAEAIEEHTGFKLSDSDEGVIWEHGAYVDDYGHVAVIDTECTGGYFPELEQWLFDNGIPFDRQSEGYPGAWPNSKASFRPGMSDILETDADLDGNRLLSIEEVREHVAAGDFSEWFAKSYPVISELPKIEWVD